MTNPLSLDYHLGLQMHTYIMCIYCKAKKANASTRHKTETFGTKQQRFSCEKKKLIQLKNKNNKKHKIPNCKNHGG